MEEQFRFVSKIGRSQMEKDIVSRVKDITIRSAKILGENSGIGAQLENNDIEEYVRLVVREKEMLLKRKNHLDDSNSGR